MSAFERHFCFAAIHDVQTDIRFLRLLYARQLQMNHVVCGQLMISDEVIFWLNMMTIESTEELNCFVHDCIACGYIKELDSLPWEHDLLAAMLRYAEGKKPIPTRILHPNDMERSVGKWLKAMGCDAGFSQILT